MPEVWPPRNILPKLHISRFPRQPFVRLLSSLLIDVSLLVISARQRFSSPTRHNNQGECSRIRQRSSRLFDRTDVLSNASALCLTRGPEPTDVRLPAEIENLSASS